jgi:cytochrome c biogenesis protein CcmG, thiol:disulfide interchange protein DsbE
MKATTFINRCALVLLVGAFGGACDQAPPPKPISEVKPVAAANSVPSNRVAKTKVPGAVLQAGSIQAVNDFELEQTDGKKFKFADLKGKVILVDVWATWCGPCREQTPKLAALQEKYRDRGLAVVGLSLDEKSDQAEVLAFMKEAGVNYTIAYAPDNISGAFLDGTEDETGMAPIPQLFIISKEGRVVEHLIGNDPRHSFARLEEVINKELN